MENESDQIAKAAELLVKLRAAIGQAMVGQTAVVGEVVAALAASGHVLIEGVPGLGKTLLVRALAKALQLGHGRIQFTPDMMPSDITGHAVLDPSTRQLRVVRGPVFTHVLLADEINRAPAKTQSALLEVMQEYQVTLEGETLPLPKPFMVLATQNPVETEGTYPLPEAQLDRFTMKLSLGYPPLADEAKMLTEQTSDPPLDGLEPVTSAAEAVALAEEAKSIYVEESVNRYVVALLRQTRSDGRLYLGASPRSGIALLRVAKALALADGREFLVPDDVKAVAVPVLAHRLILAPEARSAGLTGADAVREALERTPVPV